MIPASGASSCFCLIQCLQSHSFPLPTISQLAQPLLLARSPLQLQETSIPQPCRRHQARADHQTRDGHGPQGRSWAFRIWSTLGSQAAAFWNRFDRRHVALVDNAALQNHHRQQIPPRRKPSQDSRTTHMTGSPVTPKLWTTSWLPLRRGIRGMIYPNGPMKTGP